MQLAQFLRNHVGVLTDDWIEFAKELRPAATGLSWVQLRNSSADIIRSIVDDMEVELSEEERRQKSESVVALQTREIRRSAQEHAAQRLSAGFTLNQLIWEYRALRANVVRRWRREVENPGPEAFDDLTLFDEALDESLIEAVDYYNNRLADARELLNGVLGHDLRNPLGAIVTSAEILEQGRLPPEQQDAVVARIRSSSTRMREMIDDLLDFTRTRLGTKLPVSPREADLGEVCERVTAQAAAQHPQADLRLERHGDLAGRWDVARLEQMLGNVVGNAIRHADPGTAVTVSAEGEEQSVHVRVSNTGAVIPPDEQQRIFDPLRRATGEQESSQADADHLGLGLYIALKIAEAHNGTIDVDSSKGRGTTFTVHLPRRKPEGSETAGVT
ncbi:MAG: sensor histidine kinase [Pseudomonadota bacterium]